MSRVLTTTRTLGDIVPLSLSDGGQLDATVVDATGAGGVTFTQDLLTSTSLMQWVAGISGSNGSGGVVPLRTQTTIKQTQGGTLIAPTNEFPLKFQPRNPVRASFAWNLETAFFNGVDDNIMGLGYNAGNLVAAEPLCQFTIESDFSPSPGAHQLECYIASATDGVGTNATRPIGYVLNRVSGAVSLSLQWSGGQLVLTGGPVGGPIATQWTWLDNALAITPGLYQITSVGEVDFNFGTVFRLISSAVATLSELSVDGLSVNDHTRSSVAFIDNFNSPGNCLFYPFTTATGGIGKATNVWADMWMKNLHLAGATTAASATAGASGSLPVQVAGYLDVDINGTTQKIPFYNV